MRTIVPVAVLSCSALYAAPLAQSADYLVDLVNAERSTDADLATVAETDLLYLGSYIRPPSPSRGKGPIALPLTVTISSIDKPTYTVAEHITYEVLIRNTAPAPVNIPISTKSHLFTRSMTGAVIAVLGLTFDDELLGTHRFATDSTYGDPSVHGSLITLGHGQEHLVSDTTSTWRASTERNTSACTADTLHMGSACGDKGLVRPLSEDGASLRRRAFDKQLTRTCEQRALKRFLRSYVAPR